MIGEFQDDLKFQSLKMDFLWDDSKITHSLNILKRNRLQGWLHSRMSLCLSRLHTLQICCDFTQPGWSKVMLDGNTGSCNSNTSGGCRVGESNFGCYLSTPMQKEQGEYFAELIWLLMQQNYDLAKEKRWGNINHKLCCCFFKIQADITMARQLNYKHRWKIRNSASTLG